LCIYLFHMHFLKNVRRKKLLQRLQPSPTIFTIQSIYNNTGWLQSVCAGLKPSLKQGGL
jgi:hypothetical protein